MNRHIANSRIRGGLWTGVLVTLAAVFISAVGRADYYAAQNGQTPGSPYTSWATAASNIQEAVDAAPVGATVWVGAGRYTVPPVATNYEGATCVVYIARSLVLRSSNSVPETTLIDGEGMNRCVTWVYRTGSSTNRFILDGFTLTNGTSYPSPQGGGMHVRGNTWTGTVMNCHFRNNMAVSTNATSAAGGGLYVAPDAWLGFIVSNCVFQGNVSTNQSSNTGYAAGGGAAISAPALKRFIACSFLDNVAGLAGGGASSRAVYENCLFRGNRTLFNRDSDSGGGGCNGGGTFYNCLFYNNASANVGGGIYVNNAGAITLNNCTVVSNRSVDSAFKDTGGGIRCRRVADVLTLVNSIVYSNFPGNIASVGGCTNAFTNSCIADTNNLGPFVWNNCITNNPQFTSWPAQDYHLSRISPCLNAGLNEAWMSGATDLDGNPRLDGGNPLNGVDMGCYEFVFPRGMLIMMR